jgi:hypothetical protein
MPPRSLRPSRPMTALTRRLATLAAESLMKEPRTEGTVFVRLATMRRCQYRALCALAGDDSPQEVMDFALRATGVRPAGCAARRRLQECEASMTVRQGESDGSSRPLG